MIRTVFKGNIVLPDRILHRGCVCVSGERISGVHEERDLFRDEGVEIADYGDAYIAPGLMDLHLHGAMGKDVMDCREESLRTIAEHQAKQGVTGFLGSTMSAPLERVTDAVHTIRDAAELPLPSQILGVYIEGPFVSTQKKGAHSASFIRGVTEEDRERLTDAAEGLKAIISLAPEIEENMRFIPEFVKQCFVVAIGHTNATYEQAKESMANGVSLATHLYNAMSGFGHREPGVVGAVLDSEDVMAELIADGVHVHPAALRMAVAVKGPRKICLVTDSMMAAGQGEGVYRWGDNDIEVKGNRATVRGSGVLAGSVLTMNRAIKNMMDWTGVTLSQAVNMASLNPARILGIEEDFGSIQNGKFASLVVLDREFRVLDTVLKGKSVKSRIP